MTAVKITVNLDFRCRYKSKNNGEKLLVLPRSVISYPTTTKKRPQNNYREFFPTLSVKTTDFQLISNFDQMHTVTIFGEHGIMAHIP